MKHILAILKKIAFLASRKFYSCFYQNRQRKKLIIVKIDEIGDYVLFRNFLEAIRLSKKYSTYEITLCGNSVWRDLSVDFDQNFVDSFIWLDKSKFVKGPIYRFVFLMSIKREKYDILLSPTYSRSFYLEDELVKQFVAAEKIGFSGDYHRINVHQKNLSDQYYSQLVYSEKKHLFEFLRNKEFFEYALSQKLKITQPYFNLLVSKRDFIVIFPGAGAEFRRWNCENYSHLTKLLINKYNLTIKIVGSANDYEIAKEILLRNNYHPQLVSLVGKTKLPDLVKLIAEAKVLISNETGAVHIAASVGTKTICISNGNHYLRFNPYPEQISDKILTIYPKDICKIGINKQNIADQFEHKSNLDINKISVEEVSEAFKETFVGIELAN